MPHAVASRVLPGEQGRACRRALRHHIRVRESHALARQPVQIRRWQFLRTITSQRGPALVIREDEEDVRARLRRE